MAVLVYDEILSLELFEMKFIDNNIVKRCVSGELLIDRIRSDIQEFFYVNVYRKN